MSNLQVLTRLGSGRVQVTFSHSPKYRKIHIWNPGDTDYSELQVSAQVKVVFEDINVMGRRIGAVKYFHIQL